MRRVRYSKASSGVRISGSETISASGVPQRFKSRYVRVADSAKPSWMLLPASSSMCRRVMPMRLHPDDEDLSPGTPLMLPSAVGTSIQPCSAMGLSNCEI